MWQHRYILAESTFLPAGTVLRGVAVFDNHPVCNVGGEGQRDVCPPKQFEGLPDVLYFGVGVGDCQFLHVSRSTGVTAVGSQFVSFGTLFLDFDRDGDEDVFVSNGHVIRFPANAPVRQVPLLLENRNARFVNVAPDREWGSAICGSPILPHGAAGEFGLGSAVNST